MRPSSNWPTKVCMSPTVKRAGCPGRRSTTRATWTLRASMCFRNWLARLPPKSACMDDVLVGSYAPRRWVLWPPDAIRIVNWNIERGLRLREIIDFLASQKADLFILQEVDLNARRTHFLNIAEEIAQKLQMNYVFGREFQELAQGRPTAPAYHGQATLSRWNLRNPRVIHFRRQSNFWRPRWYLPRTSVFQERLGGRIALVTELEAPRE